MDLSQAEANMKAGRYDEAQKEFRRLVILYPTNAKLHAYEGVCYFRQENFEAAVPCLTRAVNLEPTYADAGIKLAQAYDRLKRYEEAFVVVTDFLKVKPGDATLQGLSFFLKDRVKGNRKDGWERSIALEREITFANEER